MSGATFAPVPGKIPGRLVNLGGNKLVLAPLCLDQVIEFEPIMQKLGQGDLREQINTALPLILASLTRNYPDMTLEQLRPLMDVGNLREATEAIVDVSGYQKVVPGEELPASP